MIEISNRDLNLVCGGTNFLNVVEGAFVGAAVEGTIGFFVGGPPGMFAGLCHGFLEGIGYALIYEGGHGVYDIATSQPETSIRPATFIITPHQ